MTACLSSTSIAFYDILAQACFEIKIVAVLGFPLIQKNMNRD